ncbi:hypothetical protein [Fluviicola taffensis]|uniref:Uncharacterized protein n=1 Tax=Fluviicola taffensis (strain DSM 16823 / NCIMB 13979 / RW262) TaxID=755732 RepID=F2IBF3_FLUTR|nr:hypothetical protein [Fluviicola taffensis]AEA44261.1 hypothetical protein Fluta_2275 [Fluviicola taffensis DSM 16823]
MRILLIFFLSFFWNNCFSQSNPWVQNSEYFKEKPPYQLNPFLFEDGSFQISDGDYRLKFNAQGILNKDLIQVIREEKSTAAQKTGGCTTYDMKKNIRYTLEDNLIHVEQYFSDKKNEYKVIRLEEQTHVVKSVWDEYSNVANHTDVGIITSIEDKIILYQTYFAISTNTHPHLFKPKGMNTYLRLSIVNLKDYSVSYEYVLIDVFNSTFGKKKEVLDKYDFKCIGLNDKHELLFSLSKAVLKDRNAQLLTLSDYKGVDYCNASMDVWSVNLDDFSQKKVISTSVESPLKASSVSFSYTSDGWMLSWTESVEAKYYSFHARVFALDKDQDLNEVKLNFPIQSLKLKKLQTPNIRIFKDLQGKKQFCVSDPEYPSILSMNEQLELTVFDNNKLKWDLLKNYILADNELMCLPTIKNLSEIDLENLSGLPKEIEWGANHTRILRFRKVENQIRYVHIETANKLVETGHVEKIKELYLKTGVIAL